MIRPGRLMTGFAVRGLAGLLATVVLALPQLSVTAAVETLNPDEYLVRRWTRENGLPDRRVQVIRQTPDGFLWVGTASGLARFDGVRFLTQTRTHSLELPDDDCLALAPAGASGVWLGTAAGLLRYDGTWEPATLARTEAGDRSPNAMRVLHLVGTPGGTVWVATESGLQSVQGGGDGNGALLAAPIPESPRGIRSVAEGDEAGRSVWVAGDEGVRRYDANSGTWHDVTPERARLAGQVAHLVIGSETGGFVAVLGSASAPGGHVFRWSNGSWKELAGLNLDSAGQRLAGVMATGTNAWLTAGKAGLIRVSGDHVSTLQLPVVSDQDVPLSLEFDHEGSLWVGMSAGGLLQMRPRRIRIIGRAEGLPDDRVNCIAACGDGCVWIGTEGGLKRWPPGNEPGPPEIAALASTAIRAMAMDPDGRLWLATTNGLRIVTPPGIPAIEPPAEWAHAAISDVHVSAGDRVWFATGRGIGRFEAGEWWRSAEAVAPANGWIPAVVEDRLGRVWATPAGNGLLRHDGETWTAAGWLDRFALGHIRAIHEDDQGNLWFGSNRGLLVLRNDRPAVIRTQHGLPDDVVHCVLDDGRGNLWVRHSYGLYRAPIDGLLRVADGDLSSVLCIPYGEEDGLTAPGAGEVDRLPEACRDTRGRLWFPGAKGVVLIDPRDLPDNTSQPLAVVEALRVDGRPWFQVMAGGDTATSPHDRFRDLDQELILPPGGARVLEIAYTAPTFISASGCRFSYRLQGVDAGWTAGLPWRTARYSNLPPGHYVFELRAVNAYGVGGPVHALRFRIRALFYQSVWSQSAGVLLVGGILWAGYRWRLGHLGRVQAAERRVALLQQRMKLARDLHDGLGANLTHLTLLAGGADPAERGSGADRLRQVSEGTREAAAALREIIWATHPDQDTVRSLVSRIEQTASQLCEARDLPLRIKMAGSLPELPVARETRLAAYYAAKEALNNLVRHAQATEARLEIELNGDTLRIAIADNGRGFDPKSPPPSTSGHGLGSMVDRLAAVEGNTNITSATGSGTTVTLTVPLAPPGSQRGSNGHGGRRPQPDRATR